MKKIIIACVMLLTLPFVSCEDFEGGLTKKCICYELNEQHDTIGTNIINKKDYGISRADGCLTAERKLTDSCGMQYRIKCDPYSDKK